MVGPSVARCQSNPSGSRGTPRAGLGGLSRNRNHAGGKEGIWEGQSNTTNREVVNHANRMLHDFEIMFDDLFSESGLSLDRCRAFLAIVEAGGITQASEGSTSRQSQLSRQLGELETWLGAKLLTRGRDRFSLTETGKELALILRTSFSGLDRLRTSCSNRLPLIRIGAGESLLQWIVIPGLAEISSSKVKARWSLKNLRSEDVFNGLVDGSLDFGIVRRSSPIKALRSESLGQLAHGLFVPERLYKQATGKQPFRLPLAILEGENHLKNLMENLPIPNPKEVEVLLECSSLSQSTEAVREGMAAAILPMAATPRLASFGVVSIPIMVPKSEATILSLVWNPTTARIVPYYENVTKTMVTAFSNQVRGVGLS